MAFVDSIALRDMLLNEANMFPADELYDEWSNDHVRFKAELPDSFCVDLRGFAMPTTNTKITDIFGYRPRRRRVHNGIDIKVYVGDTIRSAFDGKVRIVKNQGRRRGYGKYVVIRHNNGIETLYGHLSKWLVTEGQNVKAGQPIALGGNTGRSSGSHLHFETLLAGKNLNPALMFDFEKQDVTGDFYTYRKGVYQEIDKKTGKIVESAEPLYHKVRKGESLSVIARKCGVPVNTLYRLNKLTSRSVLRIGQRIRYR
ncbi:MAG: peptidoglycan DD-metalloendopeptidase family protein [Bacteroidaceae bacterium]|nr:peptidoglycan DD-metalloendopeptidase family protein [Bacteroidaceae bacterium]